MLLRSPGPTQNRKRASFARPAIVTRAALSYDHRRVAIKPWHTSCVVAGSARSGGRSCGGVDAYVAKISGHTGNAAAVGSPWIFDAAHPLMVRKRDKTDAVDSSVD